MEQKNSFSFENIFRETWSIFSKNFLSLWGIIFVVYLPIHLVITFSVSGEIHAFSPQNIENNPSLLNAYYAYVFLHIFVGILAFFACSFLVSSAYFEKEKKGSFLLSFQKALEIWPRALWTKVFYFLIMELMLILIFPGFFFFFFCYFSFVITAQTSYFGFSSIEKSFSLVYQNWKKVLTFFSIFLPLLWISMLFSYFLAALLFSPFFALEVSQSESMMSIDASSFSPFLRMFFAFLITVFFLPLSFFWTAVHVFYFKISPSLEEK